MGQKKTVAAGSVTVHLLHDGRSVCGFSKRLPRDWPDGHVWAAVPAASQVNCTRCLTLGFELISEYIAKQEAGKMREARAAQILRAKEARDLLKKR